MRFFIGPRSFVLFFYLLCFDFFRWFRPRFFQQSRFLLFCFGNDKNAFFFFFVSHTEFLPAIYIFVFTCPSLFLIFFFWTHTPLDARLSAYQLPPPRSIYVYNSMANAEHREGNEDGSLAVVGIACRFPGGCDSPEAFWDFLRKGADATSGVPLDRWDGWYWLLHVLLLYVRYVGMSGRGGGGVPHFSPGVLLSSASICKKTLFVSTAGFCHSFPVLLLAGPAHVFFFAAPYCSKPFRIGSRGPVSLASFFTKLRETQFWGGKFVFCKTKQTKKNAIYSPSPPKKTKKHTHIHQYYYVGIYIFSLLFFFNTGTQCIEIYYFSY